MRPSTVSAIGVLFLFASGCKVPRSYLIENTAAELGIGASKCTNAVITIPNDGAGNFTWLANCNGRRYECEQKCFGSAGCVVKCEESSQSRKRTTRLVVRDRLSIETGCPKEKVSIIRTSEWKNGTETAYRMTACGKTYVCIHASGRINCKSALASEKTAGKIKNSNQKQDKHAIELDKMQKKMLSQEIKSCRIACQKICKAKGEESPRIDCEKKCKAQCFEKYSE